MYTSILTIANQTLADIVALTLKDETPTLSSFLYHMFTTENQVSNYLTEVMGDIDPLLHDLQQEIDEEKKYALGSIEKLKIILSRISLHGRNYYVTELDAMCQLPNTDMYANKLIKKILGKYVKIEEFFSDLENRLPQAPILTWEQNASSILEDMGRNLNKLAANGELHKIVGRDEEIRRILQILTRQTKSNPVLVGEAGVGKTAVVEKLAFLLNEKQGIPEAIQDFSIYEIMVSNLLAAANAGQIEQVIEALIETAKEKKAILFIDEVHMLMTQFDGKIANLLKPAMARGDIKLIGATTEDEFKNFEKDKAMVRRFQPVKIMEPNEQEVYQILKTRSDEIEEFFDLIIPEVTLIKAISLSERYLTTKKQPDKSIDLLEEASSKLRMTFETRPEIIQKIEKELREKKTQLEMLTVKLGDSINQRDQKKLDALSKHISELEEELAEKEELYKEFNILLSSRIGLKEELNSAKAEYKRLMHLGNFQEAADYKKNIIPSLEKMVEDARQKILNFVDETDNIFTQGVVSPGMISKIIEEMTGIPAGAQEEEDIQKYKNITETLKQTIHGQDKAVATITEAIKRSKAGLSDKNKPIGSFLCLGPTGVGKTYFAQQLAKFMFGTEKVLHRFDMSEYMESHSVARLFGSPPGYVGYNEGGQLTEAIKRNPYSIILFDEIEKAHKRVFDAFLQILDAGRMTDGQGEVVDFKNTVIIMTSNIGSDIIRTGLEQGYEIETIETALMEEIKKHFRPEFLNRFDAKVMFNSLGIEQIQKIAESELQKLIDRLQEDNEIDLFYHMDIPTYIANEAYSIIDGARPVKRFINDVFIGLLTEKILAGEIQKGDMVYLRLDENNEPIVFAVTEEDLEVLQQEETPTLSLKSLLSDSKENYQLQQSVESVEEEKKKKKKKKKKGGKPKEKNWLSSSFTLKTETGD